MNHENEIVDHYYVGPAGGIWVEEFACVCGEKNRTWEELLQHRAEEYRKQLEVAVKVTTSGSSFVDDVREVVDWWRHANEAPGGCSTYDAINGMKEAVRRLDHAVRSRPK